MQFYKTVKAKGFFACLFAWISKDTCHSFNARSWKALDFFTTEEFYCYTKDTLWKKILNILREKKGCYKKWTIAVSISIHLFLPWNLGKYLLDTSRLIGALCLLTSQKVQNKIVFDNKIDFAHGNSERAGKRVFYPYKAACASFSETFFDQDYFSLHN